MGQAKWEKFTKEELEEIIKTSTKYSEVLEKLGYATYPTNNKIVKKICEKFNLNTNHFSGTTLKNLVNQKFGRLTVIERDNSKPKGHQLPVYWICKCDCGKEISVQGHHLLSGETQSCGCYRIDQLRNAIKLDLTGQRFGKLTVIKEAQSIKEPSGQVRSAWLCKCDCGKEVIIKTINLRNGDTKSCGCLISAGEHRITYLLDKLGFQYKKEYSFSDLKTNNGYLMRFDFAIFENMKIKCLIEYQGIGHYQQGEWLMDLAERQKRDEEKRRYCKIHNLVLIEIPYWDFDKIDENYIKEKLNEYCN